MVMEVVHGERGVFILRVRRRHETHRRRMKRLERKPLFLLRCVCPVSREKHCLSDPRASVSVARGFSDQPWCTCGPWPEAIWISEEGLSSDSSPDTVIAGWSLPAAGGRAKGCLHFSATARDCGFGPRGLPPLPRSLLPLGEGACQHTLRVSKFPPWVIAEEAILPQSNEIDVLPKLQAGQSAAGSSSHVTWHLTFTTHGMELHRTATLCAPPGQGFLPLAPS